MEQIYSRIIEFLEEELGHDTSGHSLDHAIRVYKNAKAILMLEGGNERIVLISALVHDVIDPKLFDNHREQQAKLLIFLQTLGCSQSELEQIFYIIENISYCFRDFGIISCGIKDIDSLSNIIDDLKELQKKRGLIKKLINIFD